MRTLSAAVTAEIAKTECRPRTLIELELSGGTLRYAAHHENYVFNGDTYYSREFGHSEIETFQRDQVDTCVIKIDNTDKAMSAVLAAEDFQGRTAIIKKIFLGLTSSDDYILEFSGPMDSPVVNGDKIEITVTSIFTRRKCKTPWRKFGLACNLDFCGSRCGYNSGVKQIGTADSGTTTTLVDASLPSRADNYWKGAIVRITSGTNKGQFRKVKAYTNSSKQLEFVVGFASAIDDTSEYIIECDKAKATCSGFSNQSQFDGFDERVVAYLHAATDAVHEVFLRNFHKALRAVAGRAIVPTESPVPIVYGEAKIKGILVDEYYYESEGADRIFAICEGEIDSVVKLYNKNVEITDYTAYLGTTSQSFDFHGETKYYRRTVVVQKLLPYSGVVAQWGEVPFVDAVVKGLKVQKWMQDSGGDWVEDGSPAWSDNNAWCILDFLMNRSGVPYPAAAIDFESFYDAAADCTSLGFKIGMTIDKQEDEDDIISAMLNACRGYFSYTGNKIGLHIEQTGSSVFEFNDTEGGADNIVEGSFKYYKKRISDVPNRVIVEFIDTEIRKKEAILGDTLAAASTSIPFLENNIDFDASGTIYIADEAIAYTGLMMNSDGVSGTLTGCDARSKDYPAGQPIYQGDQLFLERTARYDDYAHQAAVGRVTEETINGSAIPNFRKAYAIAEFWGRKWVEGNLYCEFKGMVDSLKLTVGDVVTVIHAVPGWTGATFRITGMAEGMNEEVEYECELYDASFYAENEGVPTTPLTTTLPSPFEAPAHVTNLVTNITNYALESLITISFDEPTGDDAIYWKAAYVYYTTDNWATKKLHDTAVNGDEVKTLRIKTTATVKIKAVSVSTQGILADIATALEESETAAPTTLATSDLTDDSVTAVANSEASAEVTCPQNQMKEVATLGFVQSGGKQRFTFEFFAKSASGAGSINIAIVEAFESGQAESGGSYDLTDTDKSWSPGQWAEPGIYVFLTGGQGVGQVKGIVSNDIDSIEPDAAFSPVPNSTTTYMIYDRLRWLGTALPLGSSWELINFLVDFALSGAGSKTYKVLIWATGENCSVKERTLAIQEFKK